MLHDEVRLKSGNRRAPYRALAWALKCCHPPLDARQAAS